MSTYNASLKQRVIDDRRARLGIRMTKVHGVLIVVLSAVDATHHTLVITEEKDGKSSDTVDGYEKTALLKLVNHIASWNEIHGCRNQWLGQVTDGPAGVNGSASRCSQRKKQEIIEGLAGGWRESGREEERKEASSYTQGRETMPDTMLQAHGVNVEEL